MIRDLVWACITCGQEASLQKAKRAEICSACGTRYERARGAQIFVQPQGSEGRTYEARDLVALMPNPGSQGSAECAVQQWTGDKPVYALGKYMGRYECLSEPKVATLTLDAEQLRFVFEDSSEFAISLLEVTAVQPSSRALQIKTKRRPLFVLRFSTSSPKMWEERLHNALSEAYTSARLGDIVEYQPRVATARRSASRATGDRLQRRTRNARALAPSRAWQYRLASWIARNVWQSFGGGVHVEGISNIPATGPFLVLANHQSYIETMLVPAVMPRAAFVMAKSTQYASRLSGWLMARLSAFPVRRFETDPHAVRFAVDRLSEGYAVVIFAEGERSWDGRLQAARLGAVRLALAAGVPVIPCRVDGAYEAWPRWASTPQRNPIFIRFGPPLQMPRAETRAEREANLAHTVELVRGALDVARNRASEPIPLAEAR